MDTKLNSKDAPRAESEKGRSFPITYKDVGKGVLGVGVGAALGVSALPFGAVPFGIAALCASGRVAPLVYVGLCLSLLRSGGSALLLTAYTLVLLTRVAAAALGGGTLGVFYKRLFCEPLYARALICASAALGMGLYRLIRGGFLYYDLFGTLLCMAVAVVGVLLWGAISHKKAHAILQAMGIMSLCAVCVWSLKGVSFYGISLPVFVCMLSALLLTSQNGIVYGAFSALISGLCVSFAYAPLFVFGTVCYGFLGILSPLFGVFCSFAASLAWGIYIDGMGGFAYLFAALFASNFVFFAVERLYLGEKKAVSDIKQASAEADDFTERIKKLRASIPDNCEGKLADMCEYVQSIACAKQDAGEAVAILCAHIAGKKRSACGADSVCGDSFEYFCEGDNTAVAFISDGMGSGEQAARVSGVCASLLKALLPPAIGSSDAVLSAAKLVNSTVCQDNKRLNTECSSTLDVAVLDLADCRADFYKCGAAPTYILRAGAPETISARTLPIGIMPSADVGVISTSILPGDTVVMVSDGVCDIYDDSAEFFEFLESRLLTHSPKQLADAIVDYADAQGSTDDISAVVIKLEEVFRV